MLARLLNGMTARMLRGAPAVDFSSPPGAAALCAPDSLSWRVFKNPLALFVGGVAAVILELAEPRVRSGVWEHSDFRRDPVARMRRTGMAALATVYAARAVSEPLIAGVGRLHAGVQGTTPGGVAYRALDPALLDWVAATATFGFGAAYDAYARPLGAAEWDRLFAEAGPGSALYGAAGAPSSRAEWQERLTAMLPTLEPHPIVGEFLALVSAAPVLPGALRPLQRAMVRAAVALVPEEVRNVLAIADEYRSGAVLIPPLRLIGAAGERLCPPLAPPAVSCLRMGLSADYLYR